MTPEEHAELAVVHADGQEKGLRVLVSEGTQEVKQVMDNVSWSPDSKQVLTALATQGNPALQLYMVDMEGKAPPRPLPKQQTGQSYFGVTWSLDGKHILVTTAQKPR